MLHLKFNKTALLLALMAALSTGLALADDGGSTGGTGGGNAPKSSDAEVARAVEELVDVDASLNYYAYSEQIFNPNYAQDPILKRALQLGVSKREVVLDNGKKLTWTDSGNFSKGGTLMPQLKDHCYDADGKETEASTDFAPMSEICFNKTLLRNYSPSELRLQMVALLYHERVHQMQKRPKNAAEKKDREAEADAVQRQLLKYVGPILPYLDHLSKLKKEAGGKSYSWSVNIVSLRPNGFQKIKTGNRSITVACNREAGNLINLNDRMAGKADAFLAPSGVMVVPRKGDDGKKQFVAITCLDAPRVRCSIGKLNTTYVFHAGDSRGSASLEGARDRMKRLVDAGYCEDVTAKNSEEEQKNGPEGDSFSAE